MNMMNRFRIAMWVPSFAAIALELGAPSIRWSVLAVQISWIAGLITAQWIIYENRRHAR